jgi:membrane-associated phospholipid phosphatase
MRGFFSNFWRNIIRCFRGYFILWYLLAITATYFLATSGFDWAYFVYLNGSIIQKIFFPAVIFGGLLPIIIPLTLYGINHKGKNKRTLDTAYAIGQAALLGLLISGAFKALTGRAHPPDLFVGIQMIDMSQVFQFGFWRAGVFWGWPSTHTTIAFAMAVTIWKLYTQNKILKYGAILYAFYVGIGVSMSIHWFSDFVAGAIMGTIIGLVVGKYFLKRSISNIKSQKFL